ncbi:conserved Plasmodium protein, unknown function [Plasmodium yoelii]|uniref:RlmI-like PUA domain-containing protein n=2 Tax=Plasmodium yoelii TaxID=5861 RepID=A0AAE9WXQ5_PLAYO|nr:conserved Plasmodium protein, unknown function [Plasmodium yoelii]WBY60174.1 hypothetical protein Py17XNL_001303306 [Plasmodium yoelii yoelii]CDU20073.1 conserved Plasmodium protein, unknown function [Plasmodium yoelii]VTZ80831.1 conserved Plasmodium protein, unknown function [Plasmodium yoelii]|eukprot:XP_022813669.1 conserved Plasmodium protein, unknown function [Plasmodium yoelii]
MLNKAKLGEKISILKKGGYNNIILKICSTKKWGKYSFCSLSNDINDINNNKCQVEKFPTNFLNTQELKLVYNNRKHTFTSTYENRINVFLKPLEGDILQNGNNSGNSNSSSGSGQVASLGVEENVRTTKKGDIEKGRDKCEDDKNSSNENKKYCLKFLQVDRFDALKNNKHKYVYDFEIENITELSKYEAGEIVNVFFWTKEEIGIGLLNRKSNIVIRIIENDIKKTINDTFFIKQIYESIKKRFKYIYNINLYEYMHSFNLKKNGKLFCKIVNSTNDNLPGLNVEIYNNNIYIRYDNLAIQKYSYIFEKELDRIFTPKNIYCKKIISKKEKRAQKGKEYILEQIKGDDLELNYFENGYQFFNNITNITYDIFHLYNKQDRIFIKTLSSSSNILNINGNVGEYIIGSSLKPAENKDMNCNENISIILSDCIKNTNYIEKNVVHNNCKHITVLHRENILEELNNMHLNNLKFDLVIFNIQSSIVYRKSSYTSVYGKRHLVSFKGIHKYINSIEDILQKNGMLFITVELSAIDYDKFLNIVRCVFENKKTNISIIYENSCSIENNILSNDHNSWYLRSVCFKLGHD